MTGLSLNSSSSLCMILDVVWLPPQMKFGAVYGYLVIAWLFNLYKLFSKMLFSCKILSSDTPWLRRFIRAIITWLWLEQNLSIAYIWRLSSGNSRFNWPFLLWSFMKWIIQDLKKIIVERIGPRNIEDKTKLRKRFVSSV